jgi:DNA helicase MCM9
MFRNEVTRLDAIAAILCIESSITTSAVVDSAGDALNSNFRENPDQECILRYYSQPYLFTIVEPLTTENLNSQLLHVLSFALPNCTWEFLHTN